MASNVSSSGVTLSLKIAQDSIIKSQRDIVDGMTKAVSMTETLFERMSANLARSVDKLDPGALFLRKLERSVNQLASGAVTAGLAQRLSNMTIQARDAGDTQAQYIAGTAASLANRALMPYPSSPNQSGFNARAHIENYTRDSFRGDTNDSLADLRAAGQKIREIVEMEAAWQRQLQAKHAGQIDAMSLDPSSKRRIANEADVDNRVRLDQMNQDRTAATYNRLMVDRVTGVPDDVVRANNTHDVNRRAAEHIEAKRDRVLAHYSEFNRVRDDQDEDRQISGSQQRRRIDHLVYNDPANPDRVMEDMAARRERVLQHSSNFNRVYHQQADDRLAAGEAQRRRIDEHVYNDPHNPDLTGTRRYADMPSFMQRRIDRQSAPRHFMAGHNARFAAQNVGFGVDDAIQSYHYGGVGASIRAASNNITAIAGMTIPNPAIAAATVIGLSVATAALPSILKRFGIDDDKIKEQEKIAGIAYTKTGAVTGTIRRGGSVVSGVNADIDSIYKTQDQQSADNQARVDAMKLLKDEFNVDFERKGSHWDELSIMSLSEKDQGRYRQAMGFLNKWEGNELYAQATVKEKMAKIDFAIKNADFSVIEGKTARMKVGEQALYGAASLEHYEKIISQNAQAEINNLSPKLSPTERSLEIKRIRINAQEQLSQKTQNARTVLENNVDRAQYDRSARLSAYGYSDPLSNLSEGYQRRNEEYDLNERLSPEKRQELKGQNILGYLYQKDNIISGMLRENRVNNPIGDIQGEFAKRSAELIKLDQTGELAKSEMDEMTMNLKQNYAKQIREANIPSGTERFVSDSMVVGSREDRELEARMLGRFTLKDKEGDESFVRASLIEFNKMVTNLEQINSKLEIARLKL